MEALEALRTEGRPLLARLAEARELEEQAQADLARIARVRHELEQELEARERSRPSELYGERGPNERIRDAVLQFASGFTISELAAHCDADPKDVKRFIDARLAAGTVRDTGQKFNRKTIFEYVPPTNGTAPARERRTPPEIATRPAGDLKMATGEPVRVKAMDKLTRKARSTSGVHKHRMRDRNYERAQEARAQRSGGKKETVREANARAAMEVNMKLLREKAAKNRGKKK